MQIIVTGSIAFDYLMSFPGHFTDHLLMERVGKVSLSFLVDEMRRVRGGCAANIAYNLALLGERPAMMATAGQDFEDYRSWLEDHGVDTRLTRTIPDVFTASFFVNTDLDQNQIATFYTGAMAYARELSFHDLKPRPDMVILSPNDPIAMDKYAVECKTLGIPYIYDPGQQVVRVGADSLCLGLEGADILILNDYEFELLKTRTGLTDAQIRAAVKQAVIITRGADGSEIWSDRRVTVPVVPPQQIADPTGVGDAYRAGLLKGLALGLPWEVCGRIGALAATYTLECVGPQSQHYTLAEFKTRYQEHFGEDTFTEKIG
ncbi:MAG TPA: carbohydrate kinase family protein [Anaerolineae bacterium]|nr:carbohydrate kinase family protein [Anaerolineae bacterium]HQM13567.1 carbohydrate kinase family protein [Anaerolineae bacterium]